MKINIINKSFALLTSCLLLIFGAGCGVTHLPAAVQKNISQTNANLESTSQQLTSAHDVQQKNFVKNLDTVYFGSNITLLKNVNLPPVFNEPIQIDQIFYNLNQFADVINKISGVPVLVQTNSDDIRALRITQSSGSLADILDQVTSKIDMGWTYHNGTILIQQDETRTWSIKNIPGNLKLQNEINNIAGISGSSGGTSNSASSSGSGGGATAPSTSTATSAQQTTQDLQFSYSGDYWKALDNAIKGIISKAGSYSINDQTSSVTVTDRPSYLEKIGTYIDKQNALMSRQVVIDIEVLSVETTATDNYGINWNLALSGSNASFQINGQAAQTSSSGGTAFVPSPVFVPSATTQAFTLTSNSGSLSGSQIILNALSSITKVSNVVSTAAATLSNQPVPINFTDQINYLASVATIVTVNVGSQTSLTPGQLSVGFSMNILPVVEDDGMVRIQASISMSNLQSMTTFASGGSSIQLPQIGNRSFMQKAAVRNGDTFVVTGFDAGTNNLNQTGVGGVNNWLLGGGVTATNTRQKLVILITPRIVAN